jgi:NAD(P)-dependent dehydrogenase (short-subunit alcohol dehydrogenase family)
VSNAGIDFTGRAVLVTGAAGGIGGAVARLLAELGADLVLTDLAGPGLAAAAERLPGPGRHLCVPCDLADPLAIQALVDGAVSALGRVDALVHAGAVLKRQPLESVTPEDFDLQAHVNMAAPLFLGRAVARVMRGQGGGRMVFFSSQGAFTGGYAGSAIYAMTKAGVVSLVKSLTREYARDGITVNAVAPGAVDTPMLRDGVDEDVLERFRGMIPLGRFATTDEVARATVFLISEWASYVAGHTLDVNGGQLMR